MKRFNLDKYYAKIGWTPHKAQEAVLDAYNDNSIRDIIISGGTRFGKSALAASIALQELLKDNRRIWIVAPDYSLADKVFKYIEEFIATGFPESEIRISRRIPQRIDTKWGSWLECKVLCRLTL